MQEVAIKKKVSISFHDHPNSSAVLFFLMALLKIWIADPSIKSKQMWG